MKKYISMVLLVAISAWAAPGSEHGFLDLCVNHKDDLLGLESSRGLKEKQKINESYTGAYVFLNKRLAVLLDKFEKDRALSIEEKKEVLRIVVEIGRVNTYHGMLYYSPVVDGEIIPQIIVLALRDASVNESANRDLEFMKNADLAKYTAQILENVNDGKNPLERQVNWALLFYNSEQREKLSYLLQNDFGDMIPETISMLLLLQIKLGNAASFDRMVKILNESADFKLKENIVKALGFLGTKESIIALLRAMNDNQQLHKGYTLRSCILPAIWRNYPDDDLFLKYCRRLDDKALGGKEGIADFYRQLELWAKANVGYDLSLADAELTILDPYGTIYEIRAN